MKNLEQLLPLIGETMTMYALKVPKNLRYPKENLELQNRLLGINLISAHNQCGIIFEDLSFIH